jgi:exopolyphosphatase/guanosine-5'-triphosphate,3'-diphosphate pyrophosphatase
VKLDVLAAIDIGSNAVRLLINYVEACRSGFDCLFKKAAYLRVPIRLGEDVFTSNRVNDDKAARLLEAMQGFRHIMEAYGVSGFRACATSAMRDAANGPELIRAIKEQSGVEIEIISGLEEAELIYMAGSKKKSAAGDTTALYVDVGGGSTELVLYKDGQLHFHDSFQIGTVRMLNNAVQDSEKERFAHCLEDLHARYAPERMVASGGNINKTHKVLEKKNGDPILPDELKAFLDQLRILTIKDRMHYFDLNDYRADVIVPALEIFHCICKQCPSILTVYIPKIGLADGLIRDLCAKRLLAGTYNLEQ